MNAEPSFYTLYRRSRYRPDEAPDAGGPRQNRNELFAVAAVAFALQHDEAFRHHFLRKACLLDWPDSPPPQIEVQPSQHFDMVIKLPSASALCVIEFKINAPLENIQNPLEGCFMKPGGYGDLICHGQDYKGFRSKTYIILADLAEFDEEKRQDSLTCRRCTWGALDPGGASGGSLWNDLLNSLGELGISSFQNRALRNTLQKMNNAEVTLQAFTMHKTLRAVASSVLGLRKTPSEDIGRDKDEFWYGLNLPAGKGKLPSLKDLEAVVKPADDTLGWYGYQAGKRPSKPMSEVGVWFYCGSSQAAEATHQFIKDRLQRPGGKRPPGQLLLPPDQDHSVTFNSGGDTSWGDMEWFDAVFRLFGSLPNE